MCVYKLLCSWLHFVSIIDTEKLMKQSVLSRRGEQHDVKPGPARVPRTRFDRTIRSHHPIGSSNRTGRDSTAPKKAEPAYVKAYRLIHEVLYVMPKLKLYFYVFIPAQ